MTSANTHPTLPDDTVILRIIRPGAKWQGPAGDDINLENFQRRRLPKYENKMEPGLSVSVDGIESIETVLRSFVRDGSTDGIKLAQSTVGELRRAGFAVVSSPSLRNRAHAQVRCDACNFEKIDCFPTDSSECKLDQLQFQRDLSDLFRPYPISTT